MDHFRVQKLPQNLVVAPLFCHRTFLWQHFLPQPRFCGTKRSVLEKKRCHRNGLWHFFFATGPSCGKKFCHRNGLWHFFLPRLQWQLCFTTDFAQASWVIRPSLRAVSFLVARVLVPTFSVAPALSATNEAVVADTPEGYDDQPPQERQT